MEQYSTKPYITAQSLFEDILTCHENESMSIKEKYEAMYIDFLMMLKEKTKESNIVFSGPFPRMTYLFKKHQIPEQIYTHINGFRIRGRENRSKDQTELKEAYKYDLKALTEFISTVYGEEPKNKLKQILRFPYKTFERKKTLVRNIRIAVENWSEQYIYGRNAVNGGPDIIKIDYTTKDINGNNFEYFKDILSINCQINVVDPRFENGIYYPELMIYEPDYLIDISSIAACFTEYGNSATNYLINKIKPAVISTPILLGNFAGQLLDELINNKAPHSIKYSESVKKFFKNHALDLATCDNINGDFHIKAKQQLENLTNLISKTFKEVDHLQSNELVLEPSFLCERLGIQGRMDLLQTDYRILMEQKSGQRNFKTGKHKEAHYVQMLLYQAILHYNYGLKNEQITSFLLYSKYPDGLIEEGPAPRLLFEALKIRNEIVKNELSYVNEKQVKKIFELLTPEYLNIQHRDDKLWKEYQQPQLKELLDSYHQATKLEKAYFERLFSFVERENILSKVGSSNNERDGFSRIWNATLEEKKQTGDIYYNLFILEKKCTQQDSGYDEITFQIPKAEECFISNFRIGDVVIIYPYIERQEPNALQTMVLRGSVKEIRDERIVIKLRAPQRNEQLFNKDERWKWSIEHDFIESSYGSLYKSLYSFFSARKERRELLLNQRQAKYDKCKTLNGEYGTFNELVLRAKQAHDYFLLIGPPGTGKTSFGLVNILVEALTDADTSILLASFTNRAVDEICGKLVCHKIPFIRIGSELSCDPAYRQYLLYNKTKECSDVNTIKQLLHRTRVFVGTTSALTAKLNIFNVKHFDLAIIDEASQILEPQLLGLICAQYKERSAIEKFIFIGDHKQLPAIVQQSATESEVEEEILRNIGLTNCRESLFERLIKLQKGNPSMSYMLTKQGRMHPDVAQFSNESFYESKLCPIPLEHQRRELDYPIYDKNNKIERMIATQRVCFIASKACTTPSVKINIPEAEKVAEIIYTIWQLYVKCGKIFDANRTIGVIVPYRNQISTIHKELNKYSIDELQNITIDTVERYQGSERDIIIYDFTIHKYYQLDFLTNNSIFESGNLVDRKLNVALTRAREQLFLIGNPDILKGNGIFRHLIEYTQKIKGYMLF
ncbi:MAG: AAA family ATPase [Bacteroidales bacterium]|nr:AAA family ATPase [Bacteroidales bacterium]